METAFLKLKLRPPYKIVNAFKSSYDTLNDSEKNIFLDIACFFQGETVDYVMQLLEGCGFFPQVGIDVLVEKCLVTVSENLVRMHNLTQDVGREIINRETVQIGRCSRLWEPWRIKYLLEDNDNDANWELKTTFKRAQGTEEIEGMVLDASNLSFNVKPAAFENLLNLRLLKIYCSNPEIRPVISFSNGCINSLPNNLRLLYWENFPQKSLPQNFDPRHLVEINMPYSQLQELWGGTKNLDMLRTIRLCYSQQLVDIDDLLKAQNLEVVDVQGCTKLQSFPATCQLLHLRVVNLSGCTNIKSFPEAPPNIETLHLQGTGIREVPIVKPNGGEFVSLSEFQGLSDALKLEHLTSLVKSSSSSQDLGKLICLDLKGCSRLQSLPNMFSLEFLTVLDLSGCTELGTIQGFPRNLKELYIAGTAVREVPQLPQSLELLNAHGCVSQKSIRFDSKQLPMHFIFCNFFDLSPQVVHDFLVNTVTYVQHIPREPQKGPHKSPAFSFCAPSHANQNSILDLQPGSSVMTRLNPSWGNMLAGFAMLVEVAFSEDYYHTSGLGISCVCRWNNKEGRSHRIETNLHCWAPGKAVPKLRTNHTFVFCDVKRRPSIDIWADLVVFEFFPVNQQKKRLNDSCIVTRCGVYVVTAATGNTSLKNISPVLSLDLMEVPGNAVEHVFRFAYDGLQEMEKTLFLYIVCLFSDEDVSLVAPLIAGVDLDVSSGLEALENRSLIHVSSDGSIMMHALLRKMGKEILHGEIMLPGDMEALTRDAEVSMTSSSSRSYKYDVFPSFSGQDIRKTFLSHLFRAFERKRITTFLDNELKRSMTISPSLVKAIRESRISIVVFSKNYASSSWTLNELVEITKSKEELGQIVIPVFYNVEPSNVRKQTGEFGRQFELTCKRKTEDEKQQWRKALTTIANISGYFHEAWDSEADMMEKVANGVLEKLNTTATKDFDDFVGMEDHISKMTSFLCLESEIVRIVGIWGPLGIGKTTITRALYSLHARRFQYSIYVDGDFENNFMEMSTRAKADAYGTKVHLQRQFLSKVIGNKYIKDQKVLIIVDVDVQVLLDALLGQTPMLGSGSRIIVVTKDKGVLKSHGIDDIYEVDLPSKKQALQIFCRYAFKKNHPPDGFINLAVKVTEIVGNLPLGLRVLGSSLRGRNEVEWMDILSRIRTSLDGDIEKILRVAYDRLNDHDRIIFVHIACLFNHGTVEYVKRLLSDSHLNVVCGLASLAEKSLIRITERGNITMYQLQQHLGREIVRKESSHEPGKRRFLVDYLDICDVLMYNTGTDSILGISLDLSEINELRIDEKGFNGMRNLRFLRFYTNLGGKEIKVHVPHGLDYLSRKLRLLHWEAFPMKNMPSNFIPESLVELVMEASKLEKLWSGTQEPLGSLKCMSLRGSLDLREIPDLLYATKLERLDLGGCSSLMMLPPSIGHLHKLKDLNMELCTHLEVLPTGINLESLACLNLNGCSQLRTFPEISTNISDLYLDGTVIEEVPWWIENIFSLKILSMSGCKKLKKIAPNISKLKFLVELDFSECEALSEDSWQNHPEEISTSLMIVDMSGNSFKRIPDTWTSIQPKDLFLNNCRNLVSLPELPASLSMLMANNCGSLESLCGTFDYPQMALQFINCFSLDHQSRELILQSDCAYAILPGGELPAYFTHRADGSSLTISLPQSSLAKNFSSFKACIVVESRSGWFYFGVLWPFKGGSDKIYFKCSTNTPSTSNHLIVFNCEFSPDEVYESPAEMSYSDLQFEFFCLDHRQEIIKIKECGIHLLEVFPSAEDSGKRSETEHANKSAESYEETRNNKRMRIT